MGSLLKVFLWSYLIAGLISCDDGGSSAQKSSPEFKITLAPPVTLANRDAYKIAGTCSTKGENITVTVGALPPVENTCDEDYQWQVTVDASSINTGDPLSITATELDTPIALKVERDTTPPQVGINGDQAIMNSINQGNYRIAGSCDEVDGEVVLDVEGVEVKVICDGEDYVAEGIDLSGLDAAVVEVSVTADLKDKLGNPAPQAAATLARDIIPPAIPTITASAPINGESINSYSLSGSCAENGTDVVIIKIAGLNDLATDCTSQLWEFNVPLSELNKLPPEQQGITLIVEHRDSAGNVSSTSGTVDKDIVPPDITIKEGLELVINIENQNSYRLEGVCSENGREVSIILGSNSPVSTSCSNARWTHSPGVGEGSFSVTIKHSDAAGNTATLTSPTPLVKDVTAPVFSFDSDLDINAANENVWRISGSCPEDGTVTVTAGSLGSKSATCQNGLWRTDAFDTSSINSPGTLQLSASVVDSVGNPYTIPAKTVNKDTSGWAVQITLPADSQMATPINAANAASYPVSGTCSSQGGDVTVTVGGASATTIACSSGAWSGNVAVPDTVADADSVAVHANFGTAPNDANHTVYALKDTAIPTLGITPPPITSLNQDSYNLEGTCTDGQGAVSLDIGGISASANCASDAWQVNDLDVSSLTGSSITITVDVSDAAGNPAVQLSKTVARDVEAPTLAITSAEDIAIANKESYIITGTCGETGTDNVKITIGSGIPQTIDCTATGWTLSPTIADIPEGLNLPLVVEHRDSYGNVAAVRDQTISKDTTAPQVAITTPLVEITESNLASYPLSGTCSFGDRPLTVAVGTATPGGIVDCETGGTWSASVDISSLERGVFEVTASQTDTLGNTGDDSESITNGSMMVSAGDAHTCALKPNGQVVCWGTGHNGRLGNGGTADSSTPVDVHTSSSNSAVLSGIDGISSGHEHTCALTTDGNVKCWGKGSYGRLGDGGTADSSTPVDVHTSSSDSSALSGITAISSGREHTCAVTESGNVKCWGKGSYGRLGNGGTADSLTPVDVHTSSSNSAALSGIVAISSGGFHTCALTTGGNIKCWGYGRRGRLGNGGTADSSTPVDVHTSSSDSAALSDITAISSGREHTCALTESGNVKCWGNGYHGRLGNGGTARSSTPVDVHTSSSDSAALSDIARISSGSEHTCALTTSGNVKCWGRGRYGRLGHGGTSNSSTPVDVQTGPSDSAALSDIARISSGSEHTCALTTGSNVKCWGRGSSGQLGHGGTNSGLTPVDVHASSTDSAALDSISGIDSGGEHTCALTTGNKIKCWGKGSSGQLGNGGTAGSSTPVDVHTSSSDSSALSDIARISSGSEHTCALTTGGNVKCWGRGRYGRLGHGGTSNSSTPVDVHTSSTDSSPLGGIAGISSGSEHTCAVTTGGNVKCWGNGYHRQLGHGGTTDSSTPVDVHTSSSNSSPLDDIAAISSGNSHTCVVTTGGNVKCWGNGSSGKLGNGGTSNSSTPVDVHTSSSDSSALSDIDAISSGASHTCALTTGGKIKCWGDGSLWQLGGYGGAGSSTPVYVRASLSDSSALSDIDAISSGRYHICAVTTGGNVKCWGDGSHGQSGNGGSKESKTPVDVHTSSSDSSALSGIDGISSGGYHICAVTEGNNVKCWGDESYGQLGNNGVGAPVPVIGLGPH